MISYYRERLANLELLDRVEIVDSGNGYSETAVPTGGTRRGGWINCNTRKMANAAIAQLQGKRGFENFRTLKNDGWMVWWGDEFTDALWDDDIEAGRFFGYKESVLRRI
jgi:hypothetical protein